MPEQSGTEAAKVRLREVRYELGVVPWLRKHPFAALLVAAGAGGLVARVPRNKLLTCLDLLVQLLSDDELSGNSRGL